MTKKKILNEKREARKLLEMAHRLMQKAARVAAWEHGVTYEQARVLAMLVKADEPMKVMDISVKLMRKPHTVSGLLNRMVAKGWINKIRGGFKDHPNWVEVAVSKRGRETLETLPDLEAVELLGLGVLSNHELELLVKLLGMVVGHTHDQIKGMPRRDVPDMTED